LAQFCKFYFIFMLNFAKSFNDFSHVLQINLLTHIAMDFFFSALIRGLWIWKPKNADGGWRNWQGIICTKTS
jgi:hypothetical protein